MRIHGPPDGRVEPRRGDGGADATRTGEPPAAGLSAVAVVALSVGEMNARVETNAAARAARVASLRDDLAAGRYRIDFERLTERMLSDEVARAHSLRSKTTEAP